MVVLFEDNDVILGGDRDPRAPPLDLENLTIFATPSAFRAIIPARLVARSTPDRDLILGKLRT